MEKQRDDHTSGQREDLAEQARTSWVGKWMLILFVLTLLLLGALKWLQSDRATIDNVSNTGK